MELTAEGLLDGSILGEEQAFYVAGGALRDTLLDKPITDVDLFTWMPDNEFEVILHNKRCYVWYDTSGLTFAYPNKNAMGRDFLFELQDNWEEEYEADFLPFVSKDVPGVNLVVCKEYPYKPDWMHKRMALFPCNISKVMKHLHTGELVVDEEFIRGVNSRTVVFNDRATEKYKKKISDKYSDWTIQQEW